MIKTHIYYTMTLTVCLIINLLLHVNLKQNVYIVHCRVSDRLAIYV